MTPLPASDDSLKRLFGHALRPVLIACILFLTYGLTRPPYLSLTWGTDGGELTLAASTFGVAHPPGYGLYTLTAGVMIRVLPSETTVQKMQVFSHLTAIALSLLAGLLASYEIVDKQRRHQAFTAAALLCGWSRPIWEQALMIEVYLFLALLVTAICLLCHLRQRGIACHAPTMFFIGHMVGLAITHHLTALMWVPGIVILSVGAQHVVPASYNNKHGRSMLRPYSFMMGLRFAIGLLRFYGWGFIGLITGLWPWLYLILRAGQVLQANWGGIEHGATAFIAHITAQEYRGFLQPFSPDAILSGISQWIATLPMQITPFGVIVLLVGVIVIARKREMRLWLLAFAVWIICVAGFTGLYRAPQTQSAYTLPLIIPVVMTTIWGLMRLIGFLPWSVREMIVWMLPLLLFVASASSLDQRNDVTGVNFLAQVTRLAPTNAIVLIERDGETFLLWEAQQEGWRPDITLVNGTLLNDDWYAKSLSRLWPDGDLTGSSQAERLKSLYTTSRPLIAPRLLRPPSGMKSLPLGEGWYCLTREPVCS